MFKNMHLFHKWEKWGEIQTEQWIVTSCLDLNVKHTTIRHFQARTCSVCGKYQKRYIK